MAKPNLTKISAAAIYDLTKGAVYIATFELSRRRADELDVPGGSVKLSRIKDSDADFVATLSGHRLHDNVVLGYGDDLEEMVKACSALATHEVVTLPDGKLKQADASEFLARFEAMKPAFGPITLTSAQIACAETYAKGEFAYVVEIARSDVRLYDKALADCGDPLFRFLMCELDAREDCEDSEEAVDRLDTVLRDVNAVKYAIEDLPAPKP